MRRMVRADDRPVPEETPRQARVRARFVDAGYLVLRIAAGGLFLCHGLQKLFGLFGGLNGAAAPIASRMGFAGVMETVGGTLLVLGVLTRPVALVLAGEMLIAYVTAHLPRAVSPLQNGGEVALLYLVIFVFLALTPHEPR
jgi:putative oxidoreductase